VASACSSRSVVRRPEHFHAQAFHIVDQRVSFFSRFAHAQAQLGAKPADRIWPAQ
jgi:hypothetical protein